MDNFTLWICLWPSFVAWHSSWRWWREVQMKKEVGKWILKYILSNRLCPYFADFFPAGESCVVIMWEVKLKARSTTISYWFSPWTVLRCRAVPAHVMGLLPVAQQTQSAAAPWQVTGQHPTNFSPNTLFHILGYLAPSLFIAFLFIYFSSVTVFSVFRVF